MDEQAVLKGAKLAKTAKLQGWHGTFDSGVVDGQRITELDVSRNGELLYVKYTGNTLTQGHYTLLTRRWNVHCASDAIERLEGWPDLIKMFKWFPNLNRPSLVETYRKLPFSLEEPNDAIMQKLIGHRLHWYSHVSQKIWDDTVLVPRSSQSKNFRVVDVGHRKMFHFMGAQAGFRSVLLDTIVKVG